MSIPEQVVSRVAMMSSRYFTCFLISLSLTINVLGKTQVDPWVERKIQKLESAVERAGCQQYLAHGYRYEHMFPIDGVALDNTVVKRENDDLTYFETHLAIKAAKDGIILLSPTANPGRNDLVFEIGFGIGGNLFTIVRITKDSSNEVARVSTPYILSSDHYTKFYINISDDVLTIGKEGESPIITYSDIRLRTIKYFDISSWGANDGKFLYDCPAITPVN